MDGEILTVKNILLVEGDPRGVKLTLAALESQMKAVNQLGVFWAAVNEPPVVAGREKTGVRNGRAVLLNEKRLKDETPSPHPAPGG